MKTRQIERTAVLKEVVVAVRDVEDVGFEIFLDHKPRATAETESFALTDGVEPVAFVLADLFAAFDLDDIARALTEKTTYEVVVVDLTQETDALRVFATGGGQTIFDGDAAHFVFLQMAEREHELLDLTRFELRQKIGLVFHGIGGGAEPGGVGAEIDGFA